MTATGAVSGSNYHGIYAVNRGTDLTIAAADVTGDDYGIVARNYGSGALTVTATGAVSGRTGAGIATYTGPRKAATIVLNDGASVEAALGVAITNDAGNSTVTVNTGASVTGAIQLGDGRDSLIFDGGDFSGVTAFDGGDGADDALRFGAGAAGMLDGDMVTGFEAVRFGAGSVVSVFDTLVADVSVEAGGALGPGASPGALYVDGAFETMVGATLSFELGGLMAGTGYDVLDVAGTASLADATIFEILGFGGFVPTIGNSFDILVADDILLSSVSNLTFDFAIGGFWSASIFDLGGREALRLEAIADSVAPVPVPPALAMFGSGLVSLFGLGWARRRKQRPAA